MNKSKAENIKLADFDLLGMFELEDVSDIEALVTPIGNGKYISRGDAYYSKYSCTDASRLREGLKSMLPFARGKKAFVLLDHMANLSGKTYYAEVVKCVNNQDYSGLLQAKNCLYDDIANVINVFEGKPIKISNNVLPQSDAMLPERGIECENLALLYVYTSCFDVPKGYNVLNAGLGGIYLGPFFKIMHGTEWTNMYKSKYVESAKNSYDFENAIVDWSVFKNKKVLLLDDNIGTGDTTREIVTEFKLREFAIKYGAVQYNWLNFKRVGTGEKKDITRFNPFEVDYLTPYNYPGHKLLKHAIAMVRGMRDIDGNEPRLEKTVPAGAVYDAYLRHLKHYKINGVPDLLVIMEKGMRFSSEAGLNIVGSDGKVNSNLSKESRELIDRLDQFNQVVCGSKSAEEVKGQFQKQKQ